MEGGEQEAGAGGGTDRQSSSELSEQLLHVCVCVEGDYTMGVPYSVDEASAADACH